MFGWIRKLFTANRSSQRLAKFDHAQTNEQNYRHWQNADSLGPIASLDPQVRKKLRDRARYERDNDPYLNGLNRTKSLDLIGTGPRMQLKVGPNVPAQDPRSVEKLYARWARKSQYALRLRQMAEERPVAGEAFASIERDDTIDHPVKLRLNPFESDLVCDPLGSSLPPGNWEDGIDYDDSGKPRRYAIQTSHPGDGLFGFSKSDYTIVDADLIVHWFRPTRPGQVRGVSEYASVLGTIAQLRRYTNAVLSAAEFAASISGVMYTDGDSEDGPAPVKPGELFQLYQNMALSFPQGWKLEQLEAKQPTTSHKDFHSSKLNEIARPSCAPFNVISGNSSGYNYSSGRLDHVPYHRNTWIERDDLEIAVVDRMGRAFLREADLLGLIPESLGPVDEIEIEWQWDGFNSIDPSKDAQASQLRLQVGLTTLSEECAAEGRNWRDVLEQQAVEMKLRQELGLPAPTNPSTGPPAPDAPDDDPPDDDDTTLDRDPAGKENRVLV